MTRITTQILTVTACAAVLGLSAFLPAAAQNDSLPHKKAMEDEFGTDRSAVKPHNETGRDAAFAGAKASTEGKAGLAAGAHDPDTAEGRALVGHEAAHTVQQGSGAETRKSKHETRKAIIQNMRATAEPEPAEDKSESGATQHNQSDLEFQRERGK